MRCFSTVLGKSQEWLWDHSSGTFNERIRYDTNGDRCGWEVWYGSDWRPVERRDKKNGIVVDGLWHHLELDTNGNWLLHREYVPDEGNPKR
jgi:hypothetical protein